MRPGEKLGAAHDLAAPAMGEIALVLETRRGITPEGDEEWASRLEKAAALVRSISESEK